MAQFSNFLPAINVDAEIGFVVEFIRDQVSNHYRRDGIVVGISGGIDSAVTALLSCRAVGTDRVLGVIMPERESNPISESLAFELAQKFRLKNITKSITQVLEAFGVYDTRDSVVKRYFPEFDGSQKWKLVQPGNMLFTDALNYYSIKLETDAGPMTKRITIGDLRTIVGATDLKQRTRMSTLYQIAETENYVVVGTTNLSEAMQGFYVKYGDGGVDVEPLSYLFKTYIYQIGERLGVPAGIMKRLPSPDTFSAEVADEEFFFRLPYDKLDLFLWALRDNVPAESVSSTLKIELERAKRILRDLRHKYEISEHLRLMPAAPSRVVP